MLVGDWEGPLRLTSFALLFAVFAAIEAWKPFRPPQHRRWLANLGLALIGSVLLRILFPLAATGVALLAEQRAWGLFNALNWPLWFSLPLCVLLLDLAIYWQHRLFHHLPWLWRVHRVHHADTAVDVTTGLRFHPLELLLSMLLKAGLIIAMGAPASAVLIFEVLLNACAMFNHSNFVLPQRGERQLRRLLITPTLHRIHHSRRSAETNSNFGFSVSCWDRWFGSYSQEAAGGDDRVALGLPGERQYASRLGVMLCLPFRRDR